MEATRGPLKVMLAKEPRAYQEVISRAFMVLRPDIEVFTVDPEDLDKEFLRLAPYIVICSHLTGLVSRDALAWIELYPDGASHARVSIAGRRTTYPRMDLDTLLSILDLINTSVSRGLYFHHYGA